MAYVSGLLRGFLGISASFVLMLGCGGKSASDGGSPSTVSGGNTSTAYTTAQGGPSGLGGTSSIGSASTQPSATGGAATSNTGGSKAMSTGGTVNTGGAIGFTTGGKSSGGGTTGNDGGAGAVTSTGGKVATGGGVSTGGNVATGGAASTGGTSSNAGGSAAGGSAGSGGTGSDPLTDFCSGSESKVSYQGQQVMAPVTGYQSPLVFDCCMAYAINWHTKPSLGFDLDAEVISVLGGTSGNGPGVYPLDGSFGPLRAVVHRSTDTPYGVPTRGTANLVTAFSFSASWVLGLCLEVTDATSDLFGTRLYVPQVTVAPYASSSRFQIFLLNDSTIFAEQAAAVPLDSLVLAPNPLFDLGKIAYLVKATGEVGLNPGQKYGDGIHALLDSRLDHLPFVVLADGVRIYLGTFVNISQRVPYGPLVMSNEITSDGFFIRAPMQGTDLRNDVRIITALTETSKLIP